MRFKINFNKKAATLIHRWEYIDERQRRELYERAQEHIGKHYGELTIGEFFGCLRGDFSAIGAGERWQDVTQGQYIWAMGFASFLDDLTGTLARLTPPMTPEQKAAQAACLRVGFEESVLVFVQQYFGLHSLREAEELTLNEYMIAKKDRYNAAVFEKKLSEILKSKNK